MLRPLHQLWGTMYSRGRWDRLGLGTSCHVFCPIRPQIFNNNFRKCHSNRLINNLFLRFYGNVLWR